MGPQCYRASHSLLVNRPGPARPWPTQQRDSSGVRARYEPMTPHCRLVTVVPATVWSLSVLTR